MTKHEHENMQAHAWHHYHLTGEPQVEFTSYSDKVRTYVARVIWKRGKSPNDPTWTTYIDITELKPLT